MIRSSQRYGASVWALTLSLSTVAEAQQNLPTIDIGSGRGAVRRASLGPSGAPSRAAPVAAQLVPAPARTAYAPGFSPEKKALPIYREPTGQTFTTIKGSTFTTTPLVTIGDLVAYSPGVSFKQGNGPRDNTISIRGSGARVNGALRNIVLMEDGFMLTQPDGFSRTDMLDPHAYSGVDVYRGPSSALFGNYANGGAINFRTRSGAEINGVETGHDFGSFGYINNYIAAGKKIGALDVAIFASDVRGQGSTLNTKYNTQTINMKAQYEVTPEDRVTFKWIHNQLLGEVPARLSYNQYNWNPYQWGCYLASPICYGAATVPFASTAEQAGWHRNDRRDMFGLRWEHNFGPDTVWRTSVVYDTKDFYQPIDTPVTYGYAPSIDARTNVTHHGDLMGHDLTSYVGFWYNRMRFTTYTKNLAPFGFGDLYPLVVDQQEILHANAGGNFREELALSPTVTGVIGLAAEYSKIAVRSTQTPTFPPTPGNSLIIDANRYFWNFAPEASVTWRPNSEWQVRARASSGYGTPSYLNLLTTPSPLATQRSLGNLDIKPQRNTGFDGGVDWTPNDRTNVSVTLFHEWYENEILNQAATTGRTVAYNAPRSVHRGVEFLADWRPIDGWRLLANYTYNNQMFVDYLEQRTATNLFNRSSFKIPGVAPHELTARLSYDHPYGTFKGLGAFVEYFYKSSYYIDNGNQLTIPSYGVVNLNLHYDTALESSYLKHFTAFVQLRNVFDRTYVASAGVQRNRLLGGFDAWAPDQSLQCCSIYAGQPRAIQGGVKFSF